jgi:hypothetical protein
LAAVLSEERVGESTDNLATNAPNRSHRGLRKWLVVFSVLVVSHAISAKIGYDRLNGSTLPGLTIHSPLSDWVSATHGMDASSYLETAQNFAAGNGVVANGTLGVENTLGPFCYWGPGTPVVLGTWLRLTGGTTVWSCFLFSALVQLLAGGIAVATAALFTRHMWPLAATAFLSGCFPPLQMYFYSKTLVSSEIVALVPLGLVFFALCLAELKRAKPTAHPISILACFAVAGVCLGIASLVRDSLSTFASFIAIGFLITTKPRNLRQWGIALASGLLLVATIEAVRYPVKRWNRYRINHRVVSTSRDIAVWQVGLWANHDSNPWYQEAGIGFGEYLDPDAAQQVEAYFAAKKPQPALYSFAQLVQAIWNHPWEAIQFKVSRLPVLWFGIGRQSQADQGFRALWCGLLYAIFVGYIAARVKYRFSIPMTLYLYPLFLAGASVLIHYEFRYTFPMWQMFIVLPALWAAHATERATATATEPANAPSANPLETSRNNQSSSKELLSLT